MGGKKRERRGGEKEIYQMNQEHVYLEIPPLELSTPKNIYNLYVWST
jgi:hypothetical protein